MSGKLAEKVAVITGATQGMGEGIALLFAQEGANLVLSGRDAERGQRILERVQALGGRAEFVAGDIAHFETNQALVDRALERFGRLDVLVPNAGQLGLGSVTDVSLETWHETIAVNLHAVFYLCRAGLPALRASQAGSIVVNGSIAAFRAFPNHPAYCAAKAGLVGLVRQIALDYGPEVRANVMCPGPVDTPLIWDSARAFPDPEAAVQKAAERTLLKRLGTPLDVAKLALFLASSDSPWCTGAVFTIDGGALC
jgi:NAD(P)-dependent dehydrogenase (short-subunit alcohol dehydrogenase family)